MNQILVSEKVYVTPNMKKKRKAFRGIFFISIFLFVVLSSYGIYAEYDRNRVAETSRELLATTDFEPVIQTRTIVDDPIIVILNSNRRAIQEEAEREIEEIARTRDVSI